MKFSNESIEYLYGEVEGGHGDINAPTGWWAPLDLEPDRSEDEAHALEVYETRWLILTENVYGEVNMLTFGSIEERNRRHRDLQQAFDMFDVGVDDESVTLAIGNYLAAAIFTSGIEPSTAWSGAAQVQARDEVIEFIVGAMEAIAFFQKNTGHGWEQVGIDFWFSRNRMAQDFSTRAGAGGSGEALVEDAQGWPRLAVVVDDNGELTFAEQEQEQ